MNNPTKEQRPVCSKCQTPMVRYNVPHTGDKEQAWRLACSCKHSAVSEVVSSKDVVQRLENWGIDDADSEELYALLADAARELKDLQQFHDWASPQVHDHGRDVLEITRLRQYLGYISRMKCHPDKVATMTTLAAAIQLAVQALSGASSPDETTGCQNVQRINDNGAREIDRLREALLKYGHHLHPNCHDLTLNADGSFGERNGCLCGFDAIEDEDSPEEPTPKEVELFDGESHIHRRSESTPKASAPCSYCFGDKTVSMSDGSKRMCELCGGTGRVEVNGT